LTIVVACKKRPDTGDIVNEIKGWEKLAAPTPAAPPTPNGTPTQQAAVTQAAPAGGAPWRQR
jgi:hypothetical protein